MRHARVPSGVCSQTRGGPRGFALSNGKESPCQADSWIGAIAGSIAAAMGAAM